MASIQKVMEDFYFAKKTFQISIRNRNLNFPPITINNLFKFSAYDDRDLEYYFGKVKSSRILWPKATFTHAKLEIEVSQKFSPKFPPPEISLKLSIIIVNEKVTLVQIRDNRQTSWA